MKQLRFAKIDAFASQNSSGNPAAVVYLDAIDELSETEMLQIAKELKGFVSEVGFVTRGSDTDFRLRYFSSEREVAFCGHATIAILNDIADSYENIRYMPELTIATQTERLKVENRFEYEKSMYISAPSPKFSAKTIPHEQVAKALKCDIKELDISAATAIVNGGLETLIVKMSAIDATLSVSPDLEELKEFCFGTGVDIILVYSDETAMDGCSYRTRVFAATFGYLEDPATGSGNSAFGYHLLRCGKWSGDTLKIEQNGLKNSPNFVNLFAKEDESKTMRVWFGGSAIVKIRGFYHL